MAKITTKTLKNWGNTNANAAKKEYQDLIKEKYPDYVKIGFGKKNFGEEPKSLNCDKLIIYAWYSHGEWSEPTKEIYAKLYRPNRPA